MDSYVHGLLIATYIDSAGKEIPGLCETIGLFTVFTCPPLYLKTNLYLRNPCFLLLLLCRIRLSGLLPFRINEIWSYGSYRQSVGLLERRISPVARPLPAQDKTNT
jgi:hypothetical protein